jgi:hypothetical protein
MLRHLWLRQASDPGARGCLPCVDGHRGSVRPSVCLSAGASLEDIMWDGTAFEAADRQTGSLEVLASRLAELEQREAQLQRCAGWQCLQAAKGHDDSAACSQKGSCDSDSVAGPLAMRRRRRGGALAALVPSALFVGRIVREPRGCTWRAALSLQTDRPWARRAS